MSVYLFDLFPVAIFTVTAVQLFKQMFTYLSFKDDYP